MTEAFSDTSIKDVAALSSTCAVLIILTFISVIVKYRDGRAFGTSPRKDLYTIPGIFNVDGDRWYAQRKATARIFTEKNFKGVISSAIEEDLKTLKDVVSRMADSGEPFDLSGLFFGFTLNSFCRMAFGQDIGSVSLNVSEQIPFVPAFDYAQSRLSYRFRNPFWRYEELFSSGGRKMRKAVKTIDEFVYGIIKEHENHSVRDKAEAKDEVEKLDLLRLYMSMKEENGQPLSRKALGDATLNLIIAGRDTTAQTLSWTMFHLMLNPHFVQPIHAEIDGCGACTYESYKTMTQSLAALHEGLRLHPVVPKQGRTALGDDQLPDGGPTVRKGDLLRWSDWEMARDMDVWGPDAETFRPGRWVEEDGSLRSETQWKYHVFNGGPRLCLGRNLALFESTTVLTSLLRDFDFKFAPGYLDNVEMCYHEKTPRYGDSVTLPLLELLMVVAAHRGHEQRK
ncbi:cytochrome P450, family 4, subfamily A [Pseudohyphozyma bogoriensis]|nr:cytochrome P450, family 4, subfamily A [Pseudohyphozyma bogoriensis]